MAVKRKKSAKKPQRNRTIIKAKRVTVLKANGAKRRRNSVTGAIKRTVKKAAGKARKAVKKILNPTPAELSAIYKEALRLDRAGDKKFKEAGVAHDKLWSAETGSAEAKRWNAEWRRLEAEGTELKKKAKAKFDYYDRLKAQQNPRRGPKSAVKKSRNVEQGYYDPKGQFHPVRSSADYSVQKEGQRGTFRGEVFARDKRTKQWHRVPLGKTSWSSKAAAITAANTETTRRGKRGQYAAFKAVPLGQEPNPSYLVTAEKTIKQARDLGILVDRSAKTALARARKLYGGQGLKKFAAKKRNSVTDRARRKSGSSRSKKRRNSAADHNRQEFAGSVTAHKEMYFPAGAPHGLSTLGPLVMIRTESGDIKPVAGSAYLCQDEKGHLHLGTSKPNAPLYDGPAQSFGKITRVEYRCRKPHLDYPDTVTWFHDFEDPLPILKADGKGGLTIAGGGYRIRREGIVG